MNKVIVGDCIAGIRELESGSVDCVVTSPPYYKLRDYNVAGQWGQEETVEEYVENIAFLLEELRRVVKPTGNIFLNVSDKYGKFGRVKNTLLLIPERIKLKALDLKYQVRNDIIWAKTNATPESVKTRFSRKYENIIFLTFSTNNYFDLKSVAQPLKQTSIRRIMQAAENDVKRLAPGYEASQAFTETKEGLFNARIGAAANRKGTGDYMVARISPEIGARLGDVTDFWTVPISNSRNKHVAAMNDFIPSLLLLAGCPPKGLVLDPFCGSGTTLVAAKHLGLNYVGVELNPEYAELSIKNLAQIQTKLL